MKKILLIIAVITILSGCGTNDSLTCSVDNTVNNITSKTNYVIDYKDNDIKMIKLTYDYKSNNNTDGVGTGTDGTTSDDGNSTNDGTIGGVVGKALDDVVDTTVDGILDISGIKTRHTSKFGTYTNINGFTSDVNIDDDTNYKVIYTYDLSKLSDSDITNLGISRDFNNFKTTLTNRGLTCK